MFTINDFLLIDRRTGGWIAAPAIPKDKLPNINCHKYVLYALGLITREELLTDPQIQKQTDPSFDFTYGRMAKNVSHKEFKLIDRTDSLKKLASELEIGKLYMGQIQDSETGELAHSFFIKRIHTEQFECYSKLGFKHYPFSINDLVWFLDFVNEKGEKSYQNQKWRFVPVTEVAAWGVLS